MSISVLDYFKAKQEATISPVGIKEMQKEAPDSLLIIDVRIGPVPSRIPWALVIPEPEIKERMKSLPKDKLLVVYCWDTWCSLGTKAAITLLENKYKVKELFGGIAAWETMGFPIVRGEEAKSV
jgi:rhodanese-related sulfurtransferase